MTQSNYKECSIFGQKLLKILVCYFVKVLETPTTFAEVFQKSGIINLPMKVMPP